VWSSVVNGRQLHFRLIGINNQNFVMEDRETRSWWQQVSGLAFLGPMKGQRLTPVAYDQLTFATWRSESPHGRVLRPDEKLAKADKYAKADWETRMLKNSAPASAARDTRLQPRARVIGVEIGASSKAYAFETLEKSGAILDQIGGRPVLLVRGADRRSIRVFNRLVDGRALEFVVKPEATTFAAVDLETGSEWDFTGTAVRGPLTGQRLERLPFLEEYWFDWKAYHPQTLIFAAGR
jgi:Protein of unknown function (DUF3179)